MYGWSVHFWSQPNLIRYEPELSALHFGLCCLITSSLTNSKPVTAEYFSCSTGIFKRLHFFNLMLYVTVTSLIPASSFINYSQVTLKIIYNPFLPIKIPSAWVLLVFSLVPHLFSTTWLALSFPSHPWEMEQLNSSQVLLVFPTPGLYGCEFGWLLLQALGKRLSNGSGYEGYLSVPRSVCPTPEQPAQLSLPKHSLAFRSMINAFQPHQLCWKSSLDLASPAQECTNFKNSRYVPHGM